MARAVIFYFEIFDVRFGTSVPKNIKMGGVAIALPKNGDHNPALSIVPIPP